MEENFRDFLENAIRACDGSTAYSMDRNRPYDGQSHTDTGLRGSYLVEGLTMRDIVDCYVRALVLASDPDIEVNMDLRRKLKEGSLIWDNVYEIQGDSDPIAIAQNMMCEVEKMMGIYPNVPGLESIDVKD